MAEKIRVQCGECGKKLACPASAAGKKVKCPECGTGIAVKKATRNPARRKRADGDLPADPYGAPGAESGMPPRARKKSTGKSRSKSDSAVPHWSRNLKVGVGAVMITIISSGLQTVVQGKPNFRTAAGQGQLAGQLFVLAAGVITGIVIIVRSLGAKNR